MLRYWLKSLRGFYEMSTKIREFIKSLQLRLSDLLFVIGFIPLAVFLIFGQLFMQYPDSNEVALKLDAIIPLFVILLLCWGAYIVIEYRLGNKANRNVNIIFIILAIIGLIGIFTQPSSFHINMVKYNGENAEIALEISKTHYIFFAFDIISILLLIYIGLFILPKRFTGISFLPFIGYLAFALTFVVILYSYIVEHEQYVSFVKALINGDSAAMNWYGVKSFIIHKNAFGMLLLIDIIFCFINHSIKRKWFYYPLAIYFIISMLFTFCKTSLIIAPIIFVIYLYYDLISTLKINKKRNLILLISITSVFLIAIMIVGISYLSKGKYLEVIYNLIKSLTNDSTLSARELIWNNTFQLITQTLPLSFIFGRGFGLINEMLLPMNMANGDSHLAFPTHNAYLNLLAEGGLVYLFAYLVLLGYMGYITYKCFKKNPSTTIAIALGLLSFVFYSLIETIHYLAYLYMFVMIVANNVWDSKKN